MRTPKKELPFRVITEGPHVGLDGVGHCRWYATREEAAAAMLDNECQVEQYPGRPAYECAGDCEQIKQLDLMKPGGVAEYIARTKTGSPIPGDGLLW